MASQISQTGHEYSPKMIKIKKLTTSNGYDRVLVK